MHLLLGVPLRWAQVIACIYHDILNAVPYLATVGSALVAWFVLPGRKKYVR